MTLAITICDDSALARKQVARCLPVAWDIDINYATNGLEAVNAVKEGKAELLFLDLTMPEMDGYQVLEHLFNNQIQSQVIVISGDIQQPARDRVMSLGAIAFIQKPIDIEKLNQILVENGLLNQIPEAKEDAAEPSGRDQAVPLRDSYREVANIAMGQAADLLNRLLNAFVILPVPTVSLIEASDLQMTLQSIESEGTVSSVCQGFIGNGVSGEAMLVFKDSSFVDIAELMRFEGELDENVELELLMDIASILIGAFLKVFSELLDIQFSQGHPVILGQHFSLSPLIKSENVNWKETLVIEIPYTIEGYNVDCDLLILFSEDSIEALNQRVSHYSS